MEQLEQNNRYEQLRDADFVPSEAREAWILADQAERTLREGYQRRQDDKDLTPEAKQRRAAELFEAQGSSRG